MTNTVSILRPEELTPHLPILNEARALGVWLETTGDDPRTDRIAAVSLAVGGTDGTMTVDCASFLPDGRALLKRILETRAVKVFCCAKRALQFLAAMDIHPPVLFDVTLAAQLLYLPGDPLFADLERLAAHYLGDRPPTSEAACLLRLREAMIPQIRQHGLVRVAEIEFQCVRAVAHMEYGGIRLDEARWRALLEETLAARRAAMEALQPFLERPMRVQNTLWGEEETIGPNFDSPCFVLALLRRHGIDVRATAKADLYPYRSHPLVRALSDYRKAAKAISSFLRPYLTLIHPQTGRLHPTYEQLAAYSGRMSCAGPNIQQIPREMAFRACFNAPPGRRLILADYSQIELRVVAQIAKDPRMLAAYRAGEDLHLLTASHLSGKPMALVDKRERQAYKAVNLGLIYGMGALGLQQTAQLTYGVDMPLADAKRFRRRFFETYGGIAEWHARIRDQVQREGRTLSGRRFAFGENAELPERSNLPVQGTAADIIKKALGLLIDRICGSDAKIVAAVHDEIVLECAASDAPQMADVLRAAMEDAATALLPLVPTPVEAVVSESWAEK